MRDDETILEYDRKIRKLANEASLIGDPFKENRLVRKVLRSLNKKIYVKSIVIAKANDIDKMTLNEVIDSLCIFETEMEVEVNESSVNNQNIAFTGETGKQVFYAGVSNDVPTPAVKEDDIYLLKDLMGPVQTPSHKGKRYIFVCVDDYSRFSWVDFLRKKSNTFESFQKLCSKVMTEREEKIQKIIRFRNVHGGAFENKYFVEFCDKQGIHHEFSDPKAPQQNGVVE
ncbi:hypothetical protein H6P81_019719 [Aristolochia fimbriata]|uniref:Integrase catalytic domain-containing protein n=1 Tax=Aristolochia fimbriata TaxID=158543 RepID=A0AAV7DUA0_ARIFI|nr:hypothetical protein H6P81_019719 [Aristolochia fimbriata]